MGFKKGPRIPLEGLEIALDASSTRSYPGTGTTWYDISGNNRDFTFSTTPSFTNDGVASYWNTSGVVATGPASNSVNITNNSGYTIFFAFKTPTGSSNGMFKFYSTTANINRGIFLHPGWSNDTMYFDQGGCCNADTRTTYTNANINGGSDWVLGAVRRQTGGSTRSIYYNGSVVTTNTAAAADINLNSTGIALNNNDTGYNWIGRLAIFLTYSRGLSDNELHSIYNIYKGRFGLS
jgi:hypothetical protein